MSLTCLKFYLLLLSIWDNLYISGMNTSLYGGGKFFKLSCFATLSSSYRAGTILTDSMLPSCQSPTRARGITSFGGAQCCFVLGKEQQHVNIPEFCLNFMESVSWKVSSTQMHKLKQCACNFLLPLMFLTIVMLPDASHAMQIQNDGTLFHHEISQQCICTVIWRSFFYFTIR